MNYSQFITSWICTMSETQSNLFIWQNLLIMGSYYYTTVDVRVNNNDLTWWRTGKFCATPTSHAHILYVYTIHVRNPNCLCIAQFSSAVAGWPFKFFMKITYFDEIKSFHEIDNVLSRAYWQAYVEMSRKVTVIMNWVL